MIEQFKKQKGKQPYTKIQMINKVEVCYLKTKRKDWVINYIVLPAKGRECSLSVRSRCRVVSGDGSRGEVVIL